MRDALPEVFFRLDPHRWHDVRARRGDRSRRSPEAQKETVQEIPRRVRPHAGFYQRTDTVEVQTPGDRHRHRCAARNGTGEERSRSPQSQDPDPADKKAMKELKQAPDGTNAIL